MPFVYVYYVVCIAVCASVCCTCMYAAYMHTHSISYMYTRTSYRIHTHVQLQHSGFLTEKKKGLDEFVRRKMRRCTASLCVLAAMLPAAAGFCAPANAIAAGLSRSSSLPLLRAPGRRAESAALAAAMCTGGGGERKLIRVVGAVVLRGGRVFMAQRPLHKVRPACSRSAQKACSGPAL